MDIHKRIADYLTAAKFSSRPHTAHYPTDASIKIIETSVEDTSHTMERTVGKCMRAAYYGEMGIKSTSKYDERSQRIFRLGNHVEWAEQALLKELGVWHSNNVKFYNHNYNVSGEADIIVFSDEAGVVSPMLKTESPLMGVEMKSGYGDYFQKNTSSNPKPEHLLQVMLYIDFFKIPFMIYYVDRGDACCTGEHYVQLNEKGEVVVSTLKLGAPNQRWKGMVDERFNMKAIYDRYKQLDQFKHDIYFEIAEGEGVDLLEVVPYIFGQVKEGDKDIIDLILEGAPPRGFKLDIPFEELQGMYNVITGTSTAFGKPYKTRLMGKTKFTAAEKGKSRFTHWQCVYCNHKEVCWGDELEEFYADLKDNKQKQETV